jgi:hypothetical protein
MSMHSNTQHLLDISLEYSSAIASPHTQTEDRHAQPRDDSTKITSKGNKNDYSGYTIGTRMSSL